MPDFLREPHYRLRWPSHLFRQEIDRLVHRAEEYGVDVHWENEVKLLLNQAFTSPAPSEDFAQIMSEPPPRPVYDEEDEPF